MQEELKSIEEKALQELRGAQDSVTIDNIRVKYLGKKGELTSILRGMKDLSNEERPVIGKLANEVRAKIENVLEEVLTSIKNKKKKMKS